MTNYTDLTTPERAIHHTYITNVLCPVCGESMGYAKHNVERIPAQAAALMFGDYRRAHAARNPDCQAHRNWFKGWSLQTEEITSH